MFRYLTPARIGLLALIELYAEGVAPNAATLPLLRFILSYLLPGRRQHGASGDPNSDTAWDKLQSTSRLVSSIEEMEPLLSSFEAVDGLPGRTLWDRFLDKIWAIDSFYALQSFLDRRPQLLAKTKEELRQLGGQDQDQDQNDGVMRLTPGSPVGSFVRRSYIEFSRLTFHEVADLWEGFVGYRQPTMVHLCRRNPQHDRLGFDQVLSDSSPQWGGNTDAVGRVLYGHVLFLDQGAGSPPVGADDIGGLLEFQISRVQKYGGRVPPRITAIFRSLLGDLPAPSLTVYLSFLDSWKAGDYWGSFDSLYQYFDYTSQIRDRNFYQYALMNLAILHADFGCYAEALTTMLECIATAREKRDQTCLNFSLNWLLHFGRVHPRYVRDIESQNLLGAPREGLALIRSRAQRAGTWILSSSSYLSDAKIGLSNGESIAAGMEGLARSRHINLKYRCKLMMSPQFTLTMIFWDRLGLVRLSSIACEMYLRCPAFNHTFEDELKVNCRVAGYLAGEGQYDAAFDKLERFGPRMVRTWKPRQYCHKFRGLIRLRRDLHRGDLDAAETLVAQLLQTRADDIEPDMFLAVRTLHIEVLIARGELAAAEAKIEALLDEMTQERGTLDMALRIKLLLFKAQLFDLAGRPHKGFTLVMRAARLAWRARLLRLLWQAVGALANILISLGEFTAAADLLIAVLPRCLECESAMLSGTLYALLADARVGEASEAGGDDVQVWAGNQKRTKKLDCLTKAREALDLALGFFTALEDFSKQRALLAKKAVVMAAMGDDTSAEACAHKYLTVGQESSTATK